MRARWWWLLAIAGCGGGSGDGTVAGQDRPGEIIGRVEVAAGVPASSCSATLFSGKGASCNSDGYFHIRGATPARYELRVGGVPEVPLGQRRVPVALSSGLAVNLPTTTMAFPGSVSGRIDGTEELAEAIIGIPAYGLVVAPSNARAYFLTGVPPGVHDIVLLTAAGSIVREKVRVEPAHVTPRIDFELATLTPGVGQVTGFAQRSDRAAGEQAGIAIQLLDALDGSQVASATSAADGGFSLRPPRVGVFVARAAADPRHTAQSSLILLGARDLALPGPLVIEVDDGGDFDGDGTPDASDPDDDGDGAPDDGDAFPRDFRENLDSDRDGLGDAADLAKSGGRILDSQTSTSDRDGDSRFDWDDNCPGDANATQTDGDGDGVGDACDNCPRESNPDQRDSNGDKIGDACPGRRTCASLRVQCGNIADGQGGTLDCAGCPTGQQCGLNMPNVCGIPGCMPSRACGASDACGAIDDGCGGRIACGAGCMPGQFCNLPARACAPCSNARTCGAASCGVISYACAEEPSSVVTQSCALACSAPAVCGGAGTANQCGSGPNMLAVESANATQTVLIGQPLAPVVLRLTNSATGAPVAGVMVTCVIPPGASQLGGCGAVTDPVGRLAVRLVVGRAPGRYDFQLLAAGGGTVSVAADAGAPVAAQAGYVTTLVNVEHMQGTAAPLATGTAPATTLRTGYPSGLAVHPTTGSVYYTDYDASVVVEVTPLGIARVVAGTYNSSGSGPNQFSAARDLVLDPVRGRLYILADSLASKVKYLDLNDGQLKPFAGGGTATTPPFGDGGSATSATFSSVGALALDPAGNLYVSDLGRGVRKIDVATNIITTYLAQGQGDGKINARGKMVFDAAGNLFAGNVDGSGGCLINRYAPDGRVTTVAGSFTGAPPAEGVDATTANLGFIGGMGFDRGGNLIFTSNNVGGTASANGIFAVDRIGRIRVIVPNMPIGFGGDGGPAAQSQWSQPASLALLGDDVYVADYSNFRVRLIGSVGKPRQDHRLVLVSGNLQQPTVTALVGAPLRVRLEDLAGQPRPDVLVTWTPREEEIGVTTPLSGKTSAGGVIDFVPRVGLAVDVYHVDASVRDLHGEEVMGSPVQFMIAAMAPAPGMLFTPVNVAHFPGTASSGVATLARISNPASVAVTAGGTVYISDRDNSVVLALSPRGMLSRVAGGNGMGFFGDGGPALQARLAYQDAMVLDEPRGLLYLADRFNDRVRVIDLRPGGNIQTVFGRAGTSSPPHGDGQVGTSATLDDPASLAVDTTARKLYVLDLGRRHVRRQDLTSEVVETLAIPGCPSPLGWSGGCPNSDNCMLALRAGRLLLSGQLCAASSQYMGILEWNPADGSVRPVAGSATGGGTTATTTMLVGAAGMALDSMGRITFFEAGAPRVWRIELDERMTRLSGDGLSGYAGDFVPSQMGRLGSAVRLGYGPDGTLWLADGGNPTNAAVRAIHAVP